MPEELPDVDELLGALRSFIRDWDETGGIKAFAKANGWPYDRVRDHLTGSSRINSLNAPNVTKDMCRDPRRE